MATSTPVCSGCFKTITSKQLLSCSECELHFDLECANVKLQLFLLMKHKESWSCHLCRSKVPKCNNLNTPARSWTNMDESSNACNNTYNLPLDSSFVTQRRKTNKPICQARKDSLIIDDDSNECQIASETMKNPDNSEIIHEVHFLRNEVEMLNSRIAKILSFLEITHSKQNESNNKLAEINERLETIEAKSANLNSCDCACHKQFLAADKSRSTSQIPDPDNLNILKPKSQRREQKQKIKNNNTARPPIPSTSSITPDSSNANNNNEKQEYNKISGSKVTSVNKTVQSVRQHVSQYGVTADDLQSVPPKHNENAYIETRAKNHPRQLSQRCTAGPEVTFLKAVEPRKMIHLWNMESNAEDIMRYLQSLYPGGKFVVDELNPRGDYKSYKITVPVEFYDECISVNVWPINAQVKPWVSFRNPKGKFRKQQN